MAKAKSARKTRSAADSSAVTPISAFGPSSPGLEEQIRLRAYELFLERGGQNGCPEEDWLRAEAEVLGHSGRLTA